tara:strand:- start:151 stop:345 length:195 start_codon:yes stop_codon:yes gene_type:complete
MKIDLKILAPYIVIAASMFITWGMWSERLEAVEKKADTISQMQQDIAVIKEKIIWIEKHLVNNR